MLLFGLFFPTFVPFRDQSDINGAVKLSSKSSFD